MMRQVVLRHALSARPTAGDFLVQDTPPPACPDGGVVIAPSHLSLDPYVGSRLRGRHMGEPAPRPLHDPIPGAVVGRIVASRAPGLREGDLAHTMDGAWAEQVAAPASHVRVLDPALAPASAHLGVLGMPGLTAWAGVTQLAKVGPGDVFLVDAAAGPVGGTAGQLARIAGAAKVVGIAGGPEKCALAVERYGFDACVDYQAEGWLAALEAACAGTPPTVHFENVGVGMLTVALSKMALYGRAVLCGLVDQYHAEAPPPQIPAGLIVGKRAQLLGLVVYDFYPRWAEYLDLAAGWLAAGRLRAAEDLVHGLDAAPAHFERLMQGRNVGKAIVAL